MYLVDTNVLSASAPTKAVPRQAVREWMDRNSAGLYLSAITVAEIEQGIACCFRTGAHAKAERLAGWLETVLHLYARRVLPVDVPAARRLGPLADCALGQGHTPGLADLALAATALHQGLVVLTQKSSSPAHWVCQRRIRSTRCPATYSFDDWTVLCVASRTFRPLSQVPGSSVGGGGGPQYSLGRVAGFLRIPSAGWLWRTGLLG